MAQSKKKTSKIKKTPKKPVKKMAVKTANKSVKKTAKKVAKKSPAKKTQTAAKKQTPKNSTKPAARKTLKPVRTQMAQASKKPSLQEKIIWDQFITPLDDRLIVEIASNERTTPSGLLFIPDTVADTSGNFQAKVLVVGRGHLEKNGKVRPMDVQQGDTVVFAGFSGTKVNINGKDLTILRESEVLGIVRK